MRRPEEYADAAERALERAENADTITEKARLTQAAHVFARLAGVAARVHGQPSIECPGCNPWAPLDGARCEAHR